MTFNPFQPSRYTDPSPPPGVVPPRAKTSEDPFRRLDVRIESSDGPPTPPVRRGPTRRQWAAAPGDDPALVKAHGDASAELYVLQSRHAGPQAEEAEEAERRIELQSAAAAYEQTVIRHTLRLCDDAELEDAQARFERLHSPRLDRQAQLKMRLHVIEHELRQARHAQKVAARQAAEQQLLERLPTIAAHLRALLDAVHATDALRRAGEHPVHTQRWVGPLYRLGQLQPELDRLAQACATTAPPLAPSRRRAKA